MLEEQPTTLRLLTNPSQRVLPGIVEETLSILVDVVFYLHRLVGEDIRGIVQDSGEGTLTGSTEQMTQLGVTINDVQTRLGAAGGHTSYRYDAGGLRPLDGVEP